MVVQAENLMVTIDCPPQILVVADNRKGLISNARVSLLFFFLKGNSIVTDVTFEQFFYNSFDNFFVFLKMYFLLLVFYTTSWVKLVEICKIGYLKDIFTIKISDQSPCNWPNFSNTNFWTSVLPKLLFKTICILHFDDSWAIMSHERKCNEHTNIEYQNGKFTRHVEMCNWRNFFYCNWRNKNGNIPIYKLEKIKPNKCIYKCIPSHEALRKCYLLQ